MEQMELGLLPLGHFKRLLTLHTLEPTPSGVEPRSVASDASLRFNAGRMGKVYIDAFAEGLIASWPAWRPAPNISDQTSGLIATHDDISADVRQRFIAFLIAQRADRTWTAPQMWTAALDAVVLSGRMNAANLSSYLRSMGDVDLVLGKGTVAAGDVFVCAARQFHASSSQFSGELPWRGSVRLLSGGQAARGRRMPLPRWESMDRSDELADVLAPDAPGEYELVAEVSIDLTEESLRAWSAMRSGQPPDKLGGFGGWEDVRVTQRISIPYKVVAADTTLPHPTNDPDLASTIRSAISLDTPQLYLHSTKEVLIDLVVKDPPASLAMDVILVLPDGEVVLDWFLAREGVTTRVRGRGTLDAHTAVPSRIILRPNRDLIRTPRGVTTIYAGPDITFPIRAYIQ
jgi:hypothetical protein